MSVLAKRFNVILINIPLSYFVDIDTLKCIWRVNPKVNNRLGVIVECHYRFICCNHCTTAVGNVDGGRGYAGVVLVALGKIYTSLSIFLQTKNYS